MAVERENETSLYRCMRDHPLILKEEKLLLNFNCEVCHVHLLGETSYYTCTNNLCSYFQCKSCLELPSEIQHPLHPDHPLTLLPPNCTNHNCNSCGKKMYYCFIYHCSWCEFNLDVLCALPIALNFDYTFHKEHPLIPLMSNTASLLCKACGTKHEGIFYTCPTCITKYYSQFFIHRNCASLPKTLQHSGHNSHRLTLEYSIPQQYAQFPHKCDICLEKLHPNYWVYYCGPCRYFVHVNCATTTSTTNDNKKNTSQTEPCDETDDDRVKKFVVELIHLPLDESISLVNHLLNNMNLEDTQTVEFNPCCHEHPLKLFDVQSQDEELCSDTKICSGCIQRISNSPFYSCAHCDFFLHKCCAELPTAVEKTCRRCQNQLTFVPKTPTPYNFFLCYYCDKYCNGFAYHCASCFYSLDVKCALLPCAITHEGHLQYPQHILQLTEKSRGKTCSSCGSNFLGEFVYGCNMCSFSLHITCAFLHSTIRQKYDELHPFTLSYYPIKDHPQEYICEVCEKDLDPKVWFYHCVECDLSIHTGCTYLREEYCNVKFGGIFHTDRHEHQLTLVHKTKNPSKCYTCTRDIKCDFVFHADSTFECSQCNFKMHLGCALPPSHTVFLSVQKLFK